MAKLGKFYGKRWDSCNVDLLLNSTTATQLLLAGTFTWNLMPGREFWIMAISMRKSTKNHWEHIGKFPVNQHSRLGKPTVYIWRIFQPRGLISSWLITKVLVGSPQWYPLYGWRTQIFRGSNQTDFHFRSLASHINILRMTYQYQVTSILPIWLLVSNLKNMLVNGDHHHRKDENGNIIQTTHQIIIGYIPIMWDGEITIFDG